MISFCYIIRGDGSFYETELAILLYQLSIIFNQRRWIDSFPAHSTSVILSVFKTGSSFLALLLRFILPTFVIMHKMGKGNHKVMLFFCFVVLRLQ